MKEKHGKTLSLYPKAVQKAILWQDYMIKLDNRAEEKLSAMKLERNKGKIAAINSK